MSFPTLPRYAAFVSALFLLCLATLQTQAAPGDLDPTFGTGGKVTTPIFSSFDEAFTVAIQPDGKIVTVGFAYNGANDDFALARYNADGSLDTSFDGDGKLTTPFLSSSEDVAHAVAIQPNGKIVAVGSALESAYDFALACYNPDGSLDTSFDGDGKVTTSFGTNFDIATEVAVQPDGKIVAVGLTISALALARYNPDGSLDTSFDGDGKVTTTILNEADARAVAIQSNGKIVVAGSAYNGANRDFALARYNTNGSLDTSFDGDGKLTTPILSGDEFTSAIAVQPNGKIVVAGYTNNCANDDFALARFLGDTNAVPGNFDASFDGDGKQTTNIGPSTDAAYGVAVQRDGKIVVVGENFNAGNNDLLTVARYHPNGALDTSFDGDGIATTVIGTRAYARDVAIQTNGQIVVVGRAFNGTNFDFAVARYNTNGSLDMSFDMDGKVITPIGTSDETAYGVAIQTDGSIVVAGETFNAGNNDRFALVRYTTGGALDMTFNGTGIVTTQVSTRSYGRDVALQADGKIVVAGLAFNGTNNDFTLARYNTNGSLDDGTVNDSTPADTFGALGKVVTAIGISDDEAHGLAIQTDGKIIAVGETHAAGNDDRFAVVRYDTTGIPDITFNGSGIAITRTGNRAYARDVALQPDGKIVVVGYTIFGTNEEFAVTRYNTNGSLDRTFAEGGQIATPILAGNEQAAGVALQPNGRIIVVGVTSNGSNQDFAVARYFTDMRARSDFDGDNQTDIAVWRPSNHNWYIRNSHTNTDRIQLDWGDGALGDIATPGDYDGDNRTDIAVWRPSEGNWYIIQSTTGTPIARNWGGGVDDVPVPGDYDGDGKTDLAVFRKSEGNWYVLKSTGGGLVRGWGVGTDVPVPGDYDGDGKSDFAVFRPSEGNWYIINSATNTVTLRNWGISSDKPVPADFDGDGRTDIAIFRTGEGNWYIIQSNTNTVRVKGWGAAGDTPVAADYDLDGRADIAVWRGTEGNWYIINSSTDAVNRFLLGISGDITIPSAYLP